MRFRPLTSPSGCWLTAGSSFSSRLVARFWPFFPAPRSDPESAHSEGSCARAIMFLLYRFPVIANRDLERAA